MYDAKSIINDANKDTSLQIMELTRKEQEI